MTPELGGAVRAIAPAENSHVGQGLTGTHHAAVSVRDIETGVIDPPFGGMLHFADPDGIALALFWERPTPPDDALA